MNSDRRKGWAYEKPSCQQGAKSVLYRHGVTYTKHHLWMLSAQWLHFLRWLLQNKASDLPSFIAQQVAKHGCAWLCQVIVFTSKQLTIRSDKGGANMHVSPVVPERPVCPVNPVAPVLPVPPAKQSSYGHMRPFLFFPADSTLSEEAESKTTHLWYPRGRSDPSVLWRL